jgi:hypothetical protein
MCLQMYSPSSDLCGLSWLCVCGERFSHAEHGRVLQLLQEQLPSFGGSSSDTIHADTCLGAVMCDLCVLLSVLDILCANAVSYTDPPDSRAHWRTCMRTCAHMLECVRERTSAVQRARLKERVTNLVPIRIRRRAVAVLQELRSYVDNGSVELESWGDLLLEET